MARHIYVHIPFCIRKCDYCDFYSVPCNSREDYKSYFDALEKEITLAPLITDNNDDQIDTVYFGGGTPSVPDSSFLCKTLGLIIDKFGISSDAEITIECNPASVTIDKLVDYRAAGFNRVSFGVQSLNDKTLKLLGRLHNRDRAIEAIEEAISAGFENISADLMIGVPGQTLEEVQESAITLVSLNVTHISMYSLMIEEGTKFYEMFSETLEDYMPQEKEREMYHWLRDYLETSGIRPYEISNCGRKSVHNMSYWRGYEYYAFGPSASGYIDSKRFTHIDNVSKYIEEMNLKEPELDRIIVLDEILTTEDKMAEYAMLMLRTSEGVSRLTFRERFGIELDDVFANELKSLLNRELIKCENDAYFLTKKGLDFANEVFREFV